MFPSCSGETWPFRPPNTAPDGAGECGSPNAQALRPLSNDRADRSTGRRRGGAYASGLCSADVTPPSESPFFFPLTWVCTLKQDATPPSEKGGCDTGCECSDQGPGAASTCWAASRGATGQHVPRTPKPAASPGHSGGCTPRTRDAQVGGHSTGELWKQYTHVYKYLVQIGSHPQDVILRGRYEENSGQG